MGLERRAYARVGLLGNPSDMYGGWALSFTIADFSATVRLRPSPELLIQPHPHHDLVAFPSLPQLVSRLQSEGYYGGVRLLMAICKVFYNHCIQNNISLKAEKFTLSYDTNIPRQAGLSGSSTIVCAALSCLLNFYDVSHLIKVEMRPNLILNAEKEVGIVAGLQDRVAQVYGGDWFICLCITQDFSQEHMDKLGHGIYMPLDVNLLPPLYLIYAENPSDSGKVHSSVRQRWLDGDEFIISSMKEVAQPAFDGHKALLQKDYTELARLMNKNFDLRREMFGDDVLGSVNIKMVEAASKFTGSGGAVVALCPDGDSQVELLRKACQEAGFVVQQVKVAPSVLTDARGAVKFISFLVER
ncbi:unnamed protein product [Miscanthus lutarioriparius]|uniref:glucuronokinase n=1 Tax=Miscanthus lutarioriparius TaxID=422564 RepID=A0A811QKF7_9POAL|nr:unnamed protein product [Miscanthus lutarioriparius]